MEINRNDILTNREDKDKNLNKNLNKKNTE